jgi:hypothetical protein
MVCTIRTVSSEIILTHPIELLGDVGHVESPFGLFGDSVRLETVPVSVHDRCMVCAIRTVG